MTIRFHCGSCGKLVEAPDQAGGRRGKCPYCEGSNYIPAAKTEKEFDLAPLDEHEERIRKQEISSLFDAERDLRSETSFGEIGPRLSEQTGEDVKPADLHHLIVNYCLDMAAGNLERAQTHVDRLDRFEAVNLQAVDDFLSGRTIEPTLDAIPVKVLQGFLKNLLGQLR